MRMRNLTLLCLGLALLGYLAAPNFVGLAYVPLGLALVFALFIGKKRLRADWAALRSPLGRSRLGLLGAGLVSLALLLAVASGSFWPSLDFSSGRVRALSPQTLEFLARLDRPVRVTVHLGPEHPSAPRVRELMARYTQASARLTVDFINPQTDAATGDLGPRLVAPDSAEIMADGFSENIATVSEETINGALNRLLHPNYRLLYVLNTFGEKTVQTTGPGGLSQWAADLSARRLTALDYFWPENKPLPREASALILAGPRAPLGEAREAELLRYVENGGRLMVMVDPLVAALSPSFWAAFGLAVPEGLMIDPETNLAGTKESFMVTQAYLPHPLTAGLSAPLLWPLAGAFSPLATGAGPEPLATVFGLVESSTSSWLESDAASFVADAVRYQAGADTPGPLVTAVAAELPNGGRLVALADSDLAANGFRGFPGNRAFTSAAANWLLDGSSAPPPAGDPGQSLLLNHISARLAFWLPTVVWPALVLLGWFLYYRRRRG